MNIFIMKRETHNHWEKHWQKMLKYAISALWEIHEVSIGALELFKSKSLLSLSNPQITEGPKGPPYK